MPLVDTAKRNYLQGIMWYSNRILMGLMDHPAFGKCTFIIYCEEITYEAVTCLLKVSPNQLEPPIYLRD